jgi:lipopolysaccharide export system protein LptA
LCELILLEQRPERLEAVKDLLNDKTFQGSASQTSEYDLAQAMLLVINRIKVKSDD